MMTQDQAGNVTSADILAVGEKLEQFCRDLTPSQRAVVALLLQRAALAPADDSGVQGYAVVFEKLSQAITSGDPSFHFEATWALNTTTS